MKKYELKVGDTWATVKGTTLGMKDGWLYWEDSNGCNGLARPGTWREKTAAKKKVVTNGRS